jgi:biotin carboxyl carrier protein
MHYEANIAGRVYRFDLEKASAPQQSDRWVCRLDGREIVVDAVQTGVGTLSLIINGKSFEIRREKEGEIQQLVVRGKKYDVTLQDARSLKSRKRTGSADAGPLRLTASMPGKVVRVLAKEGDVLNAGMGIVVVEAMKMQNELRSPKKGTLKKMLAREGMNVNAGDVLAVFE